MVHNTKPTEGTAPIKLRTRPLTATFILIGGFLALLFCMALSVALGAAKIPFSTVWESIIHFDSTIRDHNIIQELRLPRVIGGAMIGASFAVAGAIMQGMTRNPMADSGLLGINAGAGFAIAVCFAFFPGLPYSTLILYAFIGAALGAFLVFGISSMAFGGSSPVRLVLAGAAVSALLAALSQGIELYFKIGLDIAFFYAGGIAGTKWSQLQVMLPWVGGALLAAIILSRSISLLSLGDDVAKGLGQRTGLVKIVGAIIVLVLAGSAVSIVGSVGFVGLIIPHLTRYLVGVDYKWIIPCSAILGSLLVVLADLCARLINPPYETPIGALIAIIGVPFFLYLARKERREL